METAGYMEYHNVLFLYLNNKYSNGLHANINKRTDEIVAFYTQVLAHKSGSISLEAVGFVENLQNRIEEEMAKIISTKCTYYWFHLYRRISPVATYSNESPQTVWLYRNILENAFLKYGRPNSGNELIRHLENQPIEKQDIASGLYVEALRFFNLETSSRLQDNAIYWGDFTYWDYLDIYSLERLAFEFWHTTVCIRRIYKGGILRISKKMSAPPCPYSFISTVIPYLNATVNLSSYMVTFSMTRQAALQTSRLIAPHFVPKSKDCQCVEDHRVSQHNCKVGHYSGEIAADSFLSCFHAMIKGQCFRNLLEYSTDEVKWDPDTGKPARNVSEKRSADSTHCFVV